MSKIGRKPIELSSATVQVNGNTLVISGQKGKLTHELPDVITAEQEGKVLSLKLKQDTEANRMVWGLHRALLANKVYGVEKGFEKIVRIIGLGFKGQLTGNKFVFSLGYSHKIDYVLPSGVTAEVDKTGQILTLRSIEKDKLGGACDAIRSFRPPEPYKGTGIVRDGEVVRRKAGKTKAKAK